MPRTKRQFRYIVYGRTFNDDNFEFTKVEAALDLKKGETFQEGIEVLSDTIEEWREECLNKPRKKEKRHE